MISSQYDELTDTTASLFTLVLIKAWIRSLEQVSSEDFMSLYAIVRALGGRFLLKKKNSNL